LKISNNKKYCNKQSFWDFETKEGDGGEKKQGYNKKKIPAAAISMSCF